MFLENPENWVALRVVLVWGRKEYLSLSRVSIYCYVTRDRENKSPMKQEGVEELNPRYFAPKEDVRKFLKVVKRVRK